MILQQSPWGAPWHQQDPIAERACPPAYCRTHPLDPCCQHNLGVPINNGIIFLAIAGFVLFFLYLKLKPINPQKNKQHENSH